MSKLMKKNGLSSLWNGLDSDYFQHNLWVGRANKFPCGGTEKSYFICSFKQNVYIQITKPKYTLIQNTFDTGKTKTLTPTYQPHTPTVHPLSPHVKKVRHDAPLKEWGEGVGKGVWGCGTGGSLVFTGW